MPRLAARAGQIVEARKPGDILELRAFRPEDIGSDRLVERALRTSADYVAGYVIAVAKADPERARLLAEAIEVPWVRPIERPNGHSRPSSKSCDSRNTSPTTRSSSARPQGALACAAS